MPSADGIFVWRNTNEKTVSALLTMIMMASVECGNGSWKVNCFAVEDDGNHYAVIRRNGFKMY